MPKVKSNIKDLTKLVDVFSKEYENQLELLQKSYNAEIIQQFNEILKKIAEDYDLNYKDLQSKYAFCICNYASCKRKYASFTHIRVLHTQICILHA